MKMESLSVSVYEFGPGVCVCACAIWLASFFFLSLSRSQKTQLPNVATSIGGGRLLCVVSKLVNEWRRSAQRKHQLTLDRLVPNARTTIHPSSLKKWASFDIWPRNFFVRACVTSFHPISNPRVTKTIGFDIERLSNKIRLWLRLPRPHPTTRPPYPQVLMPLRLFSCGSTSFTVGAI